MRAVSRQGSCSEKLEVCQILSVSVEFRDDLGYVDLAG